MKKIFFFLFLLFLPNFVSAKDLLLDNLTVKNGELSTTFEPLNTEYTIMLEETEFQIELDYQVEEGITVSLTNNHDLENDSLVTLTLTNEDKKIDYHFHILKNETTSIATFKEEPLSETQSFMFKYKLYIIPTVCLLLIFLMQRILFHKTKK